MLGCLAGVAPGGRGAPAQGVDHSIPHGVRSGALWLSSPHAFARILTQSLLVEGQGNETPTTLATGHRIIASKERF